MFDLKAVFTNILHTNHWLAKDAEGSSVSGSGSLVGNTTQLRADLIELCQRLKVKTFLDAPCGDLNWMRLVDFKSIGVEYTGMDIVIELVEANKKTYTDSGRTFAVADITTDTLPAMDIVFVRDCLVHLPLELIKQALANIKRSGSKYLLTTTFIGSTNPDIEPGAWRTIDLTAAPFNLGQPQEYLADFYRPGQFTNKRLGLWRLN